MRYQDHKFRHAVRLDQQDDDAPDKYDLLDKPGTGDLADPLEILQERDCIAAAPAEPGPYDSPAAALLHLLNRHSNDMHAVADYLRISLSYCYRRFAQARYIEEHQRSIPMVLTVAGRDVPLRPWRKLRFQRALPQTALGIRERTCPLM